MKPPHWLCKNCGIIIIDSGSEPSYCVNCDATSWQYLGYENEYDADEVRQLYMDDVETRLGKLK